MSDRYINLSDRQVKDTQNQSQDFMSINTICRRLNQQDQRIAELEEQLKNAIVPKFKINEDVYIIWHGMIIDVEIKAIGKNEYYVDTCHFDLADGYGGIFVDEDEIFKTYEETLAKLEELKGE